MSRGCGLDGQGVSGGILIWPDRLGIDIAGSFYFFPIKALNIFFISQLEGIPVHYLPVV